ncbi:MAG: 50S ribosomal protein L17 [Cyclobacteriaceae bacterium]|nr:50S ribosomal protein L17 [Cyclobacteriaceae bacterium]MCH8516139.1 50S ribosomal protein L17 [Cyclobacteriaceae bacterium]
MRHGKRFNHLSRTSSHRKAMLANMASSLILHKRITTSVAKAKALKKYVEPLITKAKNDTTHSRRMVFSYLKKKEPVQHLFDEVAGKIANRPGGYTRIIRIGHRLGDNAELCLIELVDYNEVYNAKAVTTTEESQPKKRTRRAGKKKADDESVETKADTSAASSKTEEPNPEKSDKADSSSDEDKK